MSAGDFERLYRSAARARRVSRELKPLLQRVYDAADGNAEVLRDELDALLTFLTTAAGRTDANLCTTDFFFSATEEWGKPLDHLPDSLRRILSDLGGALHDTIYAPQIASNFESLPEQLLERLRRIQ